MKSLNKKDRNRHKLITATLEALERFGYANASISEIIKIAGLSRGMVHLHFENKEALLAASAEHASIGYYTELQKSLDKAGNQPSEQILALVDYDLSDQVLNMPSVSIWYELRGAARTSPDIGRFTGTRDRQLEDIYRAAFGAMTKDPDIVQDATKGTIALSEGIWIDFMLNPKDFNRGAARRIIIRFLNGLFPKDFSL